VLHALGQTVFDLAIPAGAQKIKNFCVAVALTEPVVFGKSQLHVLGLQVKETESLKVDIKGEAANGKVLDGVQETGMGFSVLSGPTHEVMASLTAYAAGKNVQKHKPETFLSVARDGAVKCNIKSVHEGYLFFHKAGLLFATKFLFIPKSEIRRCPQSRANMLHPSPCNLRPPSALPRSLSPVASGARAACVHLPKPLNPKSQTLNPEPKTINPKS
jgi:hypothetical protein